MAVPSSGEISLGKIRQELQTANYAGGPYTSAETGLDPAENGTYATINTCSPYYPLSANPANMSEWYGYDHDAPCGASSYALAADSNLNSQNMLYHGGQYYDQVVSTDVPNALGAWSLNLWVKPQPNTEAFPICYTLGMHNTGFANGGHMTLIFYPQDPPKAYLEFYDGGTSGGRLTYLLAILNDTNNTSITGLSSGKDWANYPGSVTGSVNDQGYSMLTFVYDYAQNGTDDFYKMYWNGSQLNVPYSSTSGSSGSHNYGDPSTDNAWSDTEFYLGGSYPSELSAGLLIDECTYFLDTALSDADIAVLWNSGNPLSIASITGSITDEVLHYNFELESPLGDDVAKYNYDLSDFNTPSRTTDHA